MDTKSLKKRKQSIEKRLKDCGIDTVKIKELSYLEFNPDVFASPSDIAKRILILYSVYFASTNTDKLKKIKDWLKKVKLWKNVSDNEKKLFDGKIKDEELLDEYAWNLEKAYILAWALNLVTDLPLPTEQVTDKQFEDFMNNVPELGEENINEFLTGQSLRNVEEIFDENVFNELITAYFRDLMVNKKENQTEIDLNAAYERHYALNWLRRFEGITDWDDTDTTT